MDVRVKRLSPMARLPEYASTGAACFDLCAIEKMALSPGDRGEVRTGLAIETPEGFVTLVYARSGNAAKYGVNLVNGVGVIDADYRGEIRVLLRNDGAQIFNVEPGQRIAQAMIVPVPSIRLVESDVLSDTDRGSGGFGSTGA